VLKKRTYNKILLVAAILFLDNCAPKISNFHSYNKEYFAKSSFIPTREELKGAVPKVVVFNFNESDINIAKQSNLGKTLSLNVQNVLTKDRLARLVDRSVARKLEKEILLSQINDDGPNYLGPVVANYAVSGSISNASFNKKYSSASSSYSKEGGYRKIPAKFRYSSNVSGSVKVYEIPSMSVVENFEFSGSASRSENVQKNGGASIGFIEIGGQQVEGLNRDDGLIRMAGTNAINNVAVSLKNAFAKKGYILEKKSFKGKFIFKISLGSKDGLKRGDRFEIIGLFEEKNPITNDIETEKRILASGRVADKINPKFSWVVLDKKEYNEIVRLGDVVKFKYKESFSQAIGKYSSYIPN
jgi:hypothetical protein